MSPPKTPRILITIMVLRNKSKAGRDHLQPKGPTPPRRRIIRSQLNKRNTKMCNEFYPEEVLIKYGEDGSAKFADICKCGKTEEEHGKGETDNS